MKKIFTLLVALIAGYSISSAQNIYDSEDNDCGFGLKATWDYSVPSTNITGLNSGSGFSVGAIYDIPLYKNLFLEPGISFFYNTMDVDYIALQVNDKEIGPNGYLRNIGLRVPMILGYRFDLVDDISLSLITGPQLNIGLQNKSHFDSKIVENYNLYGNGWHRLDLQWAFGMRFHYLDNFYAEITGAVGLTNMVDTNIYKGMHARRNMVSIGVGYMF